MDFHDQELGAEQINSVVLTTPLFLKNPGCLLHLYMGFYKINLASNLIPVGLFGGDSRLGTA